MTDGPDPNRSSQPTSPTKSLKSERNGESNFEEDDQDIGSLNDGQLTNYSSQYSINMGVQQVEPLLVPQAPDGGYGWVIVFAAFMSNLVVDGISTAFSEFKQSYKERYQESDGLTVFIGSLIIGTYLLVGPLVSALCNKYEQRYVVMAGGLISGIAFMIAPASPNIYVFMLIYGVMGGLGFGMIYLPAIVVVGFYFDSKRAMATGISVAGSGVGTFLVPLICQVCIANLGWQKTIWVLAVMIFSCVFYGYLYRPLPMVDLNEIRDQEMEPLRQALSKVEDDEDEAVESPHPNRSTSAASGAIEDEAVSQNPEVQRLRSILTEGDEGSETPKSDAHKVRSHTATRSRKHTMTSNSGSQHDLKLSRGNLSSDNRLSRVSARDFNQSLSKLSKSGGASNLSIAMSGVDPKEFQRPMNRQDIFYGGSIQNLKEFKEEGTMAGYRASTLSIPRSVVGQAVSQLNLSRTGSRLGGPGIAEDEEEMIEPFVDDGCCKVLPLPMRNALSEMIDLNLLKNKTMMILCISNLLGMMGFYIPIMFLKDLSESMKLDMSLAMFLVPIFGVFNTIGRVFFGWLTDQKILSALTINNLSLIVSGLLTLACPLLTSIAGQYFYAIVFGFIISAYICLTSIVLADLMGLENLTNSFGLLVVARGIASLVGPPFAGIVYDITGSYDTAFYFGGLVLLVAGLISATIPFVTKKDADTADGMPQLQDQDNVSGKLSVLTERSEEALTDYQRTIQSMKQQHQLLQDLEEEKRKQKQNGVVEEGNEMDDNIPLKSLKNN
ncbi:MFS domain-containing protein [Caenorhabditis elegans]|uniref:MFS domain-containing protein n=1 Tax=Caenorhabditis elegans TaxID=6239 RepID=H2L0E6_CAEEL|nr:MFS domain-containing protein [Caenorhabditis elegans]CCD72668.1 MFS domain-containing protein [Caenorhabditis elegans]|eukprot:NP_001041267.1 MonoCarboxylate Transporter family [Caenorhabditis elegans]